VYSHDQCGVQWGTGRNSCQEGRRDVGETFTIGERVVWLSKVRYDDTVVRVDAQIVRLAHGRVLIRVLERAARHAEGLVDRWVAPQSLRKA
jgi:hypothetical protein